MAEMKQRIRRSITLPVVLFTIVLVSVVTLTVLWHVVLFKDWAQIRELAQQAQAGGQSFHWGLLAVGSILFIAIIVLLSIDVVKGFTFNDPKTGHATFGVGVGSLVLLLNVVLIGGYTLGCHSFRHLVAGIMDTFSKSPLRKKAYDCASCLNRRHMLWAWLSLFWVGFTDVYVRLCSMGFWHDYNTWGIK